MSVLSNLMRIKIGDKEVFASTTFAVKDNELVEMDIDVLGVAMTLTCIFRPPETKGISPSPVLSWTNSENRIDFNFLGWRNAVGSASVPIRLAKLEDKTLGGEDKTLGIQFVHYLIGNVNLVHAQILLGGSYE